MDDHNIQQLIDDFLLGRMNADEEQVFKKKMLEDPELKQEVELQQELIQGVEAFGQQQLRARLKKIHKEVNNNEEPPEKVKQLSSRRRWLGIAASIAFLIIAGYFIWINSGTDAGNSADLYAAYFQPFPFGGGDRDIADPEIQGKLALIRDLYNDKQYSKAITEFIPLLEDDPGLDSELYLVLGSSYLETEQIEKAMEVFSIILEDDEQLHDDHARWYLALAHLKNGQLKRARPFLEGLAADPSADHYDDARQLLDLL